MKLQQVESRPQAFKGTDKLDTNMLKKLRALHRICLKMGNTKIFYFHDSLYSNL